MPKEALQKKLEKKGVKYSVAEITSWLPNRRMLEMYIRLRWQRVKVTEITRRPNQLLS
jgi:hypothetical protein